MKIAITGKPRSGKTTLIKKLLSLIKKLDLKPWGFYTEEVREGGKRVGFDLVFVPSGERFPLARVGGKPPRVGKYSVLVENLERALGKGSGDLLILDEVGKMELLSPGFREFLLEALQLPHAILTYGEGIDRKIKEKIRENFRVFHLEVPSRQEVFNRISQEIRREFGHKEN